MLVAKMTSVTLDRGPWGICHSNPGVNDLDLRIEVLYDLPGVLL